MKTNRVRAGVMAVGAAAAFAASMTAIAARQPAAIAVDADDLGGIARSSNGPEAGVWVRTARHRTPSRTTRLSRD